MEDGVVSHRFSPFTCESAQIARLLRPPAVHALRHVPADMSHLHGDKKGTQ